MENENKNKELQGWKDVIISDQMPLSALVQFLNILNQRLVTVEDNIMIQGADGQTMSLTKAYEIQTQAELEKQASKEEKGA